MNIKKNPEGKGFTAEQVSEMEDAVLTRRTLESKVDRLLEQVAVLTVRLDMLEKKGGLA